jgi:peptidoglycan/LPS O-acetylase OafA/YrhL
MSKRIPQLDAVRGIAILLVILHNQSGAFPSLRMDRLFANGWMGVDLFFVLSGFLITGILLDTKETDGFFRNFYARRCLRIWPLYFTLIVFMFVVVPSLGRAEAQTVFEKSSPWWAYPLFLQNFLIASPTNAAGPLAVTWSLAIEEQFYLVWPVVVRYCSSAAIRRGALAAMCLSPVVRLYLGAHGVNLYTNVFCRLDGLMAGALMAATVRTDGFEPAVFVRRAWIALAVSLPLAFAFEAVHARWIVFSLSAAASAAFVFLALFSRQAGLRTLMTNRFLVYTGTISYGLYLLHKIPFDMAKTLRLDAHPAAGLPILVAACYAMAAASWNLLEKPYLRLTRYFVPSTASTASRATPTNRSISGSVMTSGGAKSTMSPGIG